MKTVLLVVSTLATMWSNGVTTRIIFNHHEGVGVGEVKDIGKWSKIVDETMCGFYDINRVGRLRQGWSREKARKKKWMTIVEVWSC